MSDEDTFSLDNLGEEEPEKKVEDTSEKSSDEVNEKEEKKISKKSKSKIESAFSHYQASKDVADEMLYEEDPAFIRSLNELEDIPSEGDAEVIESVELDEKLLKEEKVNFLTKIIDSLGKILVPYFFLSRYFSLLLALLISKIHFLKKKITHNVKYFSGEGKKVVIEVLKSKITKATGFVKKQWEKFRNISRKGKVLLSLSIVVFSILFYFAKPIFTGKFIEFFSPQMIATLDSVADDSFESGADFKLNSGLEKFDNSYRYPEFAILLKRLVANLKRVPYSQKNPMGVFEFYLILSNQETAVELKNRETEIRDIIQRIIEDRTYNSLVTARGKGKLKGLIRRKLNAVLNNGRAKKIFIKSVTLKP